MFGKKFRIVGSVMILWFGLFGCGGDDQKGDQGQGTQATTLSANLNSAVGLLSVDSQGGGGSITVGNMSVENASYSAMSDGSSSPLYKIKSNGELEAAITVDQGKYSFGGTPMISTIALSPAGDIYLHFERPFMYKEPPKCDYSQEGASDTDGCNIDANQMSSGYQCQLFKIAGGTVSDFKSGSDTSIECIDNEHSIESWRADNKSLFQFDDSSNLFYPGSLPNRGDMVLYRLTRDGSSRTEIINANICVQNYLVTNAGGVFYTGTSSCQNGGGSDGGFFRYVAPASAGVREIARNWWNFVYEPEEGVATDKVVFFGPDPTSASTASWDSACLFGFDPSVTTGNTDATTALITCGNDIWRWIDMNRTEDVADYGSGYSSGNSDPSAAWTAEFTSRCTSEGQTFAGGGSQISAIKQTSGGDIYVIGNLRVKKLGEISCNIDVKGPHCKINGVPYFAGDTYTADGVDYTISADAGCAGLGGTWEEDDGWCAGGNVTTEAACTAANGDWQSSGSWCANVSFATRDACAAAGVGGVWNYNSVWYSAVSDLCSSTSANNVDNIWNENVTSAAETPKFSVGWSRCNVVGGGDWTTEYKSLAKVNRATKSLTMLSSTSEQAVKLWMINDVPYYTTFNTSTGKYYLKKWNGSSSEVMAENFEAYNLSAGSSATELYYDGLDFSSNSYSFGTVNLSNNSRTAKTGLTGQVKTIVVLP